MDADVREAINDWDKIVNECEFARYHSHTIQNALRSQMRAEPCEWCSTWIDFIGRNDLTFCIMPFDFCPSCGRNLTSGKAVE